MLEKRKKKKKKDEDVIIRRLSPSIPAALTECKKKDKRGVDAASNNKSTLLKKKTERCLRVQTTLVVRELWLNRASLRRIKKTNVVRNSTPL
jgi:hypothetical protein